MFKFNWKMGKDKWLLLILFCGVILVLMVPSDGAKQQVNNDTAGGRALIEQSYEQQLENRVKKILKQVEGVGNVDVMIVLKSSEEKIMHVDKSSTESLIEEEDTNGGKRRTESKEGSETTVMSGGSSDNQPVIEKEIKPQIEGIIISASGGESPKIKAEISGAMEALFGLPSHKIKVLKRVE